MALNADATFPLSSRDVNFIENASVTRELSERDICTKFILPALEAAGWDRQSQLFEEYPLRVGRVVVRGNKGKRDPGTVRRADYVLFHKPGIPLAVIEAKDASHTLRDGIQQALAYAEMLNVPFAFSSNGAGFLFHDSTGAGGAIERELALGEFPSPAELWSRYAAWKGLPAEQAPLLAQDYHSGKRPRYYQINAINRIVEAVARGQRRLLLVKGRLVPQDPKDDSICQEVGSGCECARLLTLPAESKKPRRERRR